MGGVVILVLILGGFFLGVVIGVGVLVGSMVVIVLIVGGVIFGFMVLGLLFVVLLSLYYVMVIGCDSFVVIWL